MAGERTDRRTTEVWIAGTEEPDWLVAGTDEGDQLMQPDDTDERIIEQRGIRVVDDFVIDDSIDDDERMVVNMGPQHPSTHGVLRLHMELEGEMIRKVKPIIGYLHTGMEKTAEQLTFLQGPTNVTRMDYLAPLHNELVFSLAVEKLLGIDMPPRAQAIRILMTELNRISSHLVAAATNGLDLGSISMMFYGVRERELILAFLEKVTGLRMNHNYIRPGGVAADLPDDWEGDIAHILEEMPAALVEYDSMLRHNRIWQGRTVDVAIITSEEALAYGITGPTLRATGYAWDLRVAQPYSGFEQYEFDVVTASNGDAYDRYRIRMEEITESLRIIEQVANSMPSGDYKADDRKVVPPPRKRINESMEALIHHFKIYTEGFKVPEGEVYVAVESPRGELGCYLVSDGGSKPLRMHIRAPSFSNIQALPIMMTDSMLADTIAAIASIDPVMGDVDR